MNLSDADLIALVDSCLDDKMSLYNICNAVRAEMSTSLLQTTDAVVWAIKNSKHVDAPAMFKHIKENMSRYKNA